jgi:lysozyme
MRANARAVALIKKYEGLRLTAYLCPAKVWTIGWGHTGDVKRGDKITEHQAEAILDVDLDTSERIVGSAVKVTLTENQFSALVSFVLNVGPGRKAGTLGPKDDGEDGFVVLKSGKPSTFLRLLNAGDTSGAAEEFLKWKYAAGRVMPGLLKRRIEERALFIA